MAFPNGPSLPSSTLHSITKCVFMYCLITLLMLQVCMALYEDQVGLFDWRQQYIGEVEEVYFEQQSHSSRRVFVSTKAGVLAALNARTGSISWRKVLEKKRESIQNLLYDTKHLITVSASGNMVRSWDANKGHVVWEVSMEQSLPSGVLGSPAPNIGFQHRAIIMSGENDGIALISQGVMRLLSPADGSTIWEAKANEDGALTHYLGFAVSNDKLFAFFVKNKVNLVVKNIDIENGKTLSENEVSIPWTSEASIECELISSYLVCLDKSAREVHVLDYSSSGSAFASSSLDSLHFPLDADVIGMGKLNRESSHFILKSHGFIQIISISKGSLSVLKKVGSEGFFTEGFLGGKNYLFFISSNNVSIIVEVFSPNNLDAAIEDLKIVVPYNRRNHGPPIKGVVFMYSKKNDIGYRILLSSQDHSICLIQSVTKGSGKILWDREEGLASITAVEMMELPPSTSASKLELLHEEFSVSRNAGILAMFLNRIKSQIRQFQAFTQNLKKKQHNIDGLNGVNDQDKTGMLKRDQFSLSKVIIVVTKAKKIFAINSQNGDIVWSQFIADLKPFNDVGKQHFYLVQQRTTAHFPLPPQCVLVGLSGRKGEEGKAVIYTFNPLTGDGLETGHGSMLSEHKVAQVAQLPFEDDKSAKIISVIDSSLNLHMFPKTATVNGKVKSMFYYLVDHEANKISGYLTEPCSNNGKCKLKEVWGLNIPSGQKILDIVTKREDEVVNSMGRVLGDHTVLYKYLNPNLIAFATIQDRTAKGSIFVYVVDAITGHVIYHARHKSATTPVNLILSEHWLLYVYYNPKGKRNELSVVEFYEDGEAKDTSSFSSLDSVDLPLALSQGYILHASGIQGIATTNTERGITHKNILLALESGYILSLPKNFLDPRRSFQHTSILAEEGLAPYMPEIPVMPQSFINYNATVAQMRGIYTSAAGLESTSLVLAYGLDLYYTRVMPSKMFDVLKEDFDYIFISGVLSALILASILCSKLASIKSLNLSWK